MNLDKKNKKTDIEHYVVNYAKSLRINAKMSQAELAFKLNVSTGFVGKVESDLSTSKYNLNHVNQLAEIFAVSPQNFLPKTHIKTNGEK
jgi:transcriptional regulator with XRE-family HTH domain